MLETILPPLGLAFAAICILMVIVPYLRGRRDLISTWTIFFAGMANYVGISSWQAGSFWGEFDIARYTGASDKSVLIFVAGVALLMLGLIVGYYSKMSAFVEQHPMRKWPVDSPAVLLFCIASFCSFAVVGGSFFIQIPILTQIAAIGGQAVIPVAVALAIALWLRMPINPMYIAILIFVLVLGLVFSFTFGSSRRPLLALLAAGPILLYFKWGRYQNRPKTILVLAVTGLFVLSVIGAHSQIRHRGGGTGDRIATAIETAKMLPSAVMQPQRSLGQGLLGGDTISVTLGLIEIGDQVLPPSPLHTVKWLVGNPVPRIWWPTKPEGVGETFPRDLGQWRYGKVNWGVGIIGQFYYDGGLYIIPFFGFLLGASMRWFDHMLLQQPHNIFLLALLVGFSAHWVAVPRGEVGLFLLQTISVFLFTLPFYFVSRRIIGQSPAYASAPATATA